ncbi:hypothetical protein P3T40_007876 [Paraburkholderia sp. EB58]|jgi:hypothetical protein|uniref:DUF6447 family protein n=1 Tax=Paraburkholderia sp. EB58 TaxID=3035125 RepID=UPI003D1B986C
MARITIDGVPYEVDALNDTVRQQLANVHTADAEIQRLRSLLAIASTARAAYADALRNALPPPPSH